MTVVNGKLTQLSVSEVERFESCPRAWWFERANELRPDQTKAQAEGEAGHAHLARYLSTGERPTGRKLMGKAASGAIVKGDLPKPGHPVNDLLVELRFSGQDKFSGNCRGCGHPESMHHGKVKKIETTPASKTACTDHDEEINACDCTEFSPEWIPLDTTETLHLGGVPWEGFIDLAFRRGPIPEVWDHKFFSPCNPEISDDPYHWLKKPADLIKTIQMPVYAKSQMPYWPDAKQWRLVHHCVSKSGVDSVIRSVVVTTEQINARCVEIEAIVERMKLAASATEQTQLAGAPRRVCESYGGCPHQSICSAYQEKPTVQLSPEEAAMFDNVPAADAPVGKAAASAAPAASEPDPFDDIPDLDDATSPAAAVVPALQALAPAAPKLRMKFIDTPAEGEPVPAPVASPSTAPVIDPVKCSCGEVITSENGSQLQDKTWKHIGCRLNAPPPAPVVARTRKPKAPPAESAPEPAPTAPVKVIEVAKPAPVVETEPQAVERLTAEVKATELPPDVQIVNPDRERTKRMALASVFDSIAALLRAA